MTEPVPAAHTAITGRTQLVAILGDPIAQVSSPTLINQRLAARRDASATVLVPLHVSSDALATVVAGLRAVQNFRGAVVTMPHKRAIVPLLDEVTGDAAHVGACNVLRREAGGRLVGTMLDGEGFVAGLRAVGREVTGQRVYLSGAGGAAAGIAFALARHGVAHLSVYNRSAARAQALVQCIRDAWPHCAVRTAGRDPAGHNIAINATSLGMSASDPLPFDPDGLRAGMLVAEVVANPAKTRLLLEAGARGCSTHPGAMMLEGQIDLLLQFMGV
jgi:shikimate dehydrogenase